LGILHGCTGIDVMHSSRQARHYFIFKDSHFLLRVLINGFAFYPCMCLDAGGGDGQDMMHGEEDSMAKGH
jgi:hypothetical protein